MRHSFRYSLLRLTVGGVALLGFGSGHMQGAGMPVLTIFAAKPGAEKAVIPDSGVPLLTVRSVREIKMDYEKQTVTVWLKEEDRKMLALLTREFTGQALILSGPGPAAAKEVMKVTGPIADGRLSFHAGQDAPMFASMVSRFDLALPPSTIRDLYGTGNSDLAEVDEARTRRTTHHVRNVSGEQERRMR